MGWVFIVIFLIIFVVNFGPTVWVSMCKTRQKCRKDKAQASQQNAVKENQAPKVEQVVPIDDDNAAEANEEDSKDVDSKDANVEQEPSEIDQLEISDNESFGEQSAAEEEKVSPQEVAEQQHNKIIR